MIETAIEVFKSEPFLSILLIVGSVIFSILTIRKFIKINNYKKDYSKKMKELDAQKCDGPHKWVYMEVKSGEDVVNVCERCCWCPTHDSYIKKFFVDAEIESKKFKKNLEEYTQSRLEELGVSQELYDKVITIKKDFALEYMDKKIKEIIGE